MVSIQPGWLGNLNSDQETALKTMWGKLLKDDGDRNMRPTFWSMANREHPDAILLRFLRARSWNVDRAFEMMMGSLNWRRTYGVDDLIISGEVGLLPQIPKLLEQFQLGRSYFHGFDRSRRPVFYAHTRMHDPKAQSALTVEKFTIYSMEIGRVLMAHVGQICLVFDLVGFGLKNMDWGFVLFLAKSFEAYYPETLGMAIVHGAPWIFSGIWKILSPMLDPVVRSKVKFTSNYNDLCELIDPSHLPKAIGGKENWEWEYTLPIKQTITEEDIQSRKNSLQETQSSIETITYQWITPTALSPSAKSIVRDRGDLLLRYRIAAIEADPFLYPESIYHRHGNIKADGIVRWTYQSPGAEEESFGTSIEDLKKELIPSGKPHVNGTVMSKDPIKASGWHSEEIKPVEPVIASSPPPTDGFILLPSATMPNGASPAVTASELDATDDEADEFMDAVEHFDEAGNSDTLVKVDINGRV